MEIIDFPHAQIHEGKAFSTWYYDSDLDAAATIILAFKTNVREIHLTIEASGTLEGCAEINEGATWTTNTGSQNPIYNRNRTRGNNATVFEDTTGTFAVSGNVSLNPTGLSGGTVLSHRHFGAGKKVGGEIREIQEWELAPDTTYAIIVTSLDANNKVSVTLDWYEGVN